MSNQGNMVLPESLEQPFSAKELITGFYQHDEGNCVSIAAIKAALMAFGTNPVFKSVSIDEQYYVVVMRDKDFEYRFTHDELNEASSNNGFEGDNQLLLSHAEFMFAAMVKRAQMENNDGHAAQGYTNAIRSLNDGENWQDGPRFLGLHDHYLSGLTGRRYNFFKGPLRQYIKRKEAGIAKSPKHTWFTSKGLHDNYGKAQYAPTSKFYNAVFSLDVEEIRGLF